LYVPVLVQTITTTYNGEYTEISEAEYPQLRSENTIILKNDGTYWACGCGLGEETLLHDLGDGELIEDMYVICSSEFVQVENENDLRPKN
ncbi:MAG: hypothetical protein K2K17_03685, partial [Lachnospiraceae bacterium]|nr:hypothetical protein [Lachnospiraceae bacterium]